MFIIIILPSSVPSRGENGCRRSLTSCLKASCQRAPDSLVSNPGNQFWLKPAGASLGHSKASFLECSWKWNMLCGPSGSASFAQHHEFESHPNCCVDQEFILFNLKSMNI